MMYVQDGLFRSRHAFKCWICRLRRCDRRHQDAAIAALHWNRQPRAEAELLGHGAEPFSFGREITAWPILGRPGEHLHEALCHRNDRIETRKLAFQIVILPLERMIVDRRNFLRRDLKMGEAFKATGNQDLNPVLIDRWSLDVSSASMSDVICPYECLSPGSEICNDFKTLGVSDG